MSNNKHPWDKWFRRNMRFELVRDIDFECESHAMMIQARREAKRRGLKITVEIVDTSVFIQVVERLGIYRKRKKDE